MSVSIEIYRFHLVRDSFLFFCFFFVVRIEIEIHNPFKRTNFFLCSPDEISASKVFVLHLNQIGLLHDWLTFNNSTFWPKAMKPRTKRVEHLSESSSLRTTIINYAVAHKTHSRIVNGYKWNWLSAKVCTCIREYFCCSSVNILAACNPKSQSIVYLFQYSLEYISPTVLILPGFARSSFVSCHLVISKCLFFFFSGFRSTFY